MIVSTISDTHNLHADVDLPGGDLLIHAGDITFFSRRPSVLKDFNAWLKEAPYRYKVVVPGNHDTLLELAEVQREMTNAHLLINSGIILGGLKIWGSPVMPLSAGAFAMPDEGEREAHWATIPADTDILITHVPPRGILDGEVGSEVHAGCAALRRVYKRIRPKLHVFGHVHSAAGIYQTERTMFVNAALAGELGDLDRDPVSLRLWPMTPAGDRSSDASRDTVTNRIQ